MRHLCLIALLLAFSAHAATTRNNDSCDIALLPAATLLLPHFEVDLDDPNTATTLFSVTNTSNLDRIARVTLWTTDAEPVLAFNLFLTGYDAQSINLYDILGRGRIEPATAKRGRYSDPNDELSTQRCAAGPVTLDAETHARVQEAFDGDVAAGYVTTDVVDRCSSNLPTEPAYWKNDIAFDNVLAGDYQHVRNRDEVATGRPMVHIRAIPYEDLPTTFYSRYLPPESPRADRRQPLPSAYALRWKEGDEIHIWREDGDDATEIVAFDEQENAVALVDDATPPKDGWVYLNLPGQSWVTGGVDAVAMSNGCAPAPRASEITVPSTSREITPGRTDASCDIGLYPAATLLLPYFEVDYSNADSLNTTFTVTNVSAEERIAHVTLWTDAHYPVIAFNIYLTGYDVQTIDLYDVIARGIIGSVEGIGSGRAPQGAHSDPNPDLSVGTCGTLPGRVPDEYITRMQRAFAEGVVPDLGALEGCDEAGLVHEYAIGYATIDIVQSCSVYIPTQPEYWTNEIRYENVLIGDYSHADAARGLHRSGPLVHIRAVPDAQLDRTFYARYQAPQTPNLDKRQPLPAQFAARWIYSRSGFDEDHNGTLFTIWREGRSGPRTACDDQLRLNFVPFTDMVRFDDNENAFGYDFRRIDPGQITPMLPGTALVHVIDDDSVPVVTNGATAGWLYLNLDNAMDDAHASSNWVISTMYAYGRFAVDVEATALGNGCSAPAGVSEVRRIGTQVPQGTHIIGPAGLRRK